MKEQLAVYIEIKGKSIYVGNITGDSPINASFRYADEYMSQEGNRPISISLPFSDSPFSSEQTFRFFDGLLPEGFTRRCVAGWMHVDENDYLSILAGLGKECLGAVKILTSADSKHRPKYRKITENEVRRLAAEGVTESAQMVTKAHLSLTGASGKVGLYLDADTGQWYLPLGEAPSTHIVKQSHVRLQRIVANEQLCLLTAGKLGIEIPESFIINIGNNTDEDVLFATKRYDRKMTSGGVRIDGLSVPFRLHQEDFAQALGIPAERKYEGEQDGYLKKMFELLRAYSTDPMEDQLKLWDLCIFNYLIGNTDNHIKNVSLLYSEDLRAVRLAPAYDIVSTVVYENSTEDMALYIGGVRRLPDIRRQSFLAEAGHIGLGEKMAEKRLDSMADRFERALVEAQTELEAQGFYQAGGLKDKILRYGGYHYILDGTSLAS